MLTRKHFEALAAIIRRENEKLDNGQQADPRTTLNVIANKLADLCASENPNFDRDRFGRACSAQ